MKTEEKTKKQPKLEKAVADGKSQKPSTSKTKLVKIKFIVNPLHNYRLAYEAGDVASVDELTAKELIENNVAEKA